MKIPITILLLFVTLSFGQEKAHSKANLGWTHEFPEGVVSFLLKASAGTATNVLASLSVPNVGGSEFQAPLLALMGAAKNGVYTVRAYAVDHSGLESDSSEPLTLFWYGIPAAPGRPFLIKIAPAVMPPTP